MRSTNDEAILETKGISINFGGLRAVDSVDFALNEGELRCIIGPNGAGKTTFFNLLTGRLKPTAGDVYFRGQTITSWPTHRRIRFGLSRTFQITNLYDRLSVFENVRLAAQRDHEPFHPLRPHESLPGIGTQVRALLELIGLWEKRTLPSGNLSHGEKRKLELGVALALKPVILLLDEPTAGLNNLETAEMARLVRNVSATTTMLVIEHDMEFVRELADRITVLNRGCVLAEGTVQEIELNQVVREVYLEGGRE